MSTAPLSALTIRRARRSMKTLDENPDVKAMLEKSARNIRTFLATGDRSRWDPNMMPAYELQMAWAIANGRKDYLTCTCSSTGKLTNTQLRDFLNRRAALALVCAAPAPAAPAAPVMGATDASDDRWECVAYMLPTLPPLPSVAPAPAPAAPPVPVMGATDARIAALEAENAALKETLAARKAARVAALKKELAALQAMDATFMASLKACS